MSDKIPATRVKAEPNSRLEQLLALYDQYKPAADAAATRLKEVTDAIKVELASAAPGAQNISADAPRIGVALQLTYVESWRLDAKRMKTEAPELYVTYAVKSGSWTLRKALK